MAVRENLSSGLGHPATPLSSEQKSDQRTTAELGLDATGLRPLPARRAFQALLRTYFAEGGLQVQVNGLTAADLRAAIAHPEAHADLLVRLGGYSTRFVTLSPAVQREMAERFEVGL